MTLKEAIDELILDISFTVEEIENHEKFAEFETDEEQIKFYEDNKRKLEAYKLILGKVDSTLSTNEGFKERCKKVRKEVFGEEECEYDNEPNEIETELYELLKGEKEDFSLSDANNKILAKINIENGEKRVLVNGDPEDAEELSEDDTFEFYAYQGRIAVIYNGYADGEFSSYPLKFQEKALEIIKAKLGK